MKKFLIIAVVIIVVAVWVMRQSCTGIYRDVGIFSASGSFESMSVVDGCALRLMGLDEHMI